MSRVVQTPEYKHAINGVSGRMFARTVHPDRPGRWCSQRWISESRPIAGYGSDHSKISVEIRFDDGLNNGHATFAITATVRTPGRRDIDAGGCMHDDIHQHFPELAHLIRWHLCSTDGPMHYLANTLYFASDCDHNGRRVGEPDRFDYVVYFDDVPIGHVVTEKMYRFLSDLKGPLMPVAYDHDRDLATYGTHYAPDGMGGMSWARAPWRTYREADEFCRAFNHCTPRFEVVPTHWSQGKARELDAARGAACWPEATDEQLSAPRADLERVLIERLPALLADFRRETEEAGFLWSPDDVTATA